MGLRKFFSSRDEKRRRAQYYDEAVAQQSQYLHYDYAPRSQYPQYAHQSQYLQYGHYALQNQYPQYEHYAQQTQYLHHPQQNQYSRYTQGYQPKPPTPVEVTLKFDDPEGKDQLTHSNYYRTVTESGVVRRQVPPRVVCEPVSEAAVTRPTECVTIFPARHSARQVLGVYEIAANDDYEILSRACPEESRECHQMIQSSFENDMSPTLLPVKNGFVYAATKAYSSHHHLTIRPEDIWIAILTQFSFYVNANAEKLRGKFVTHQGRKQLKINTDSLKDFGVLAACFASLIGEDVRDPELQQWIMPAFSTTTPNDIIVASIVMMGTMKAYYEYRVDFQCGLPSVTLLGKRSDYELIARRLEKLCTYGVQPTEFCQLLRPVLRRFIQSFDHPTSPDIIDFWQRIFSKEYHEADSGCGPVKEYTEISGWITAFCFWDANGSCIARQTPKLAKGDKAVQLIDCESQTYLALDGVVYPHINADKVPAGCCKAPVIVEGVGPVTPWTMQTVMIAGSLGIDCMSSGEVMEDGDVGVDSMQPQLGWLLYEQKSTNGPSHAPSARGRGTHQPLRKTFMEPDDF